MKRTILAALAATVMAAGIGGAAANAAPFHGGGHGPVVHGGPVFHGPTFHGGPGPVIGGGFRSPAFGGARYGGPGFAPAAYQRWGRGEFLPRAWLTPARFVVDFGAYGLFAPGPDLQWVQDGPDALLVNLDTGMVVQVVPGAFA